jgi:hypothetical protein
VRCVEWAIVLLGVLGPLAVLIAVALGVDIWDALTPLIGVFVLAGVVVLFI